MAISGTRSAVPRRQSGSRRWFRPRGRRWPETAAPGSARVPGSAVTRPRRNLQPSGLLPCRRHPVSTCGSVGRPATTSSGRPATTCVGRPATTCVGKPPRPCRAGLIPLPLNRAPMDSQGGSKRFDRGQQPLLQTGDQQARRGLFFAWSRSSIALPATDGTCPAAWIAAVRGHRPADHQCPTERPCDSEMHSRSCGHPPSAGGPSPPPAFWH